jgi:transcriptional regulator GlxA family with amidase domain
MDIALIAFNGFTDIDIFLPWDLLNRVRADNWRVRILGTEETHVSNTGLRIPMHGAIEEAALADGVIVASGYATRSLIQNRSFLESLVLDPARQLVGSMCSGALILAALGLLNGLTATTNPTAAKALEELGVTVVEEPFVVHGNIATAAGCLAAQYLCGWMVEELVGPEERDRMLQSVQPVGEGMTRADADYLSEAYRTLRLEPLGHVSL